MQRVYVAVLVLATVAGAAAQTDVTIRSTTTLIQVNVVAHDRDGKTLADLKKEDFELLEDGKPRSIAVFIPERTSTVAAGSRALAPGYYSNQIAVQPTARGGYSIILLDYANTGFRNTARAREKAIAMVKRLGPNERVGLYIYDRNGIHIATEPGTDRAALLAKLNSAMGLPAPCFQRQLDGQDDSHDDSMANCGGPTPLAGEVKSFMVNQRVRETLLAFEAIAGHLAGLPGRKGLIWISAAFPLQIDLRAPASQLFPEAQPGTQTYDTEIGHALRKLHNADVALYPVDSRALSTESAVTNRDDFTVPTMDFFAARTGGIAFHGRNDMETGMLAAVEDVQTSYTLGFYAPQDREHAGFHKLTVRSLRPGVSLRYKEGYYLESPGKITSTDRKNDVGQALTALMDATAIPLEIRLTREKNSLLLRVALRPDSLSLEQKSGRWRGEIDFITRFAAEDGKQVATPGLRRIEFNLTQARYDSALRTGLTLSRTLEPPRTASRLRVLVRNSSGGIGTLTVPLQDLQD